MKNSGTSEGLKRVYYATFVDYEFHVDIITRPSTLIRSWAIKRNMSNKVKHQDGPHEDWKVGFLMNMIPSLLQIILRYWFPIQMITSHKIISIYKSYHLTKLVPNGNYRISQNWFPILIIS